MTALRLDLTIATYPEGARWTWSLWAGSRIVSSSGSQLFSRRVDCARGAEVGAGLEGVRDALAGRATTPGTLDAPAMRGGTPVVVRVCDERGDA